jgi:hypothetical protein
MGYVFSKDGVVRSKKQEILQGRSLVLERMAQQMAVFPCMEVEKLRC